MTSPTYQATYDLAPVARGDSVPTWAVTILRDTVAVAISSARLHLSRRGGPQVTWPLTVAGNVVTMATLPGTTTAALQVGDYDYDLEVTYADGRVRSYLRGILPVTQDITSG